MLSRTSHRSGRKSNSKSRWLGSSDYKNKYVVAPNLKPLARPQLTKRDRHPPLCNPIDSLAADGAECQQSRHVRGSQESGIANDA